MLKGKAGHRPRLPGDPHLDRQGRRKNVLKRQEYALSGRLLRTSYYPKWKKVYSESKKADVWYPEEIRFYDEVEKANQTLVLIKRRRPARAAREPVHEGLAREQESR